MLRRSQASHFVPDAFVFPGGTLDASDMSPAALARTRGAGEASLRQQFRARTVPDLPSPSDVPTQREAAGLLVAAVRELFEEAGVLLACEESGKALTDRELAPMRDRLHAARPALQKGEQRFEDLLAELDVYADAGALTLFSHWITPPVYPRRYNTHFFVAIAGTDQPAAADTVETHDGVWIAPQEALEKSAQGAFRMVYPTVKHVERLARFESARELIAFSRTKPIVSIMPQTPAEHQFALPPQLEYAW